MPEEDGLVGKFVVAEEPIAQRPTLILPIELDHPSGKVECGARRGIPARIGELARKGVIAGEMDGVGRDCTGIDGRVREGQCPEVVIGTFTITAKPALAEPQPFLNAGGCPEPGGALVLPHRLLELIEVHERPGEQLDRIPRVWMFLREALGQSERGRAIRLHQSGHRFVGLRLCQLQDLPLDGGGGTSSPRVRRRPQHTTVAQTVSPAVVPRCNIGQSRLGIEMQV